MLGTVGLEVMNTINPELNWKTIKKGRRSKKSIARSLNGVGKASNTSPESFGDYSGSDSDKVGGEPASGKEEHVPIKKRRHFLRSPSPHDSSPQIHPSYPQSEDQDRLANPCHSSGRKSLSSNANWQFRDIDRPKSGKSGKHLDNGALPHRAAGGYYYCGDFSGIELLAAAASMEVDSANADKEDRVVEDFSMPKASDASGFAELLKPNLKSTESQNCLSNENLQGDNADCPLAVNNSTAASQVPSGSPKGGTPPRSLHIKVDRRHWDLNTVMEAWDEPYDDTVAGHPSKDISDMHTKSRQEAPEFGMLNNTSGAVVESSHQKSDENKLEIVSTGRTCIMLEPTCLDDHLHKEGSHVHSNAGTEKSDQVIEKVADRKDTNMFVSTGTDIETPYQVMNPNVALGSSSIALHLSSDLLASKEKMNAVSSSSVPIIEEGGYPCNVGKADRTNASDGIHIWDQVVTVDDKRGAEISQFAINVQDKDVGDLQKTSEPPGNMTSLREIFPLGVDNPKSNSVAVKCLYSTFTSGNFLVPGTLNQDDRTFTIANSKVGSDETCVPMSTPADCKGQLELAVLVTKCENSNLPNEESQTCSTGAQFDEPTTSVGKVGSNNDNHRGSDVSPGDDGHMVNGDDPNRFQDGYDSPYEDGELRDLCSYPWEENELENACVDYESDGRNGDGSDAADYPGSEIVEGGSEISHGTRSGLLARRFPQGNGLVNTSLRNHFMKDDSDNVTGGKKDSNGGSGATVEQSMEIVAENDDVERRPFTDRKVGEYSSRMSRGKLQSRAEGESSLDAADGKGAFFMQQCRTRQFGGSYSRPERDTSPDKYLPRYKAANERDDVNQWAYWGSRSRYTSGYQGRNNRNLTGDMGVDFQDQANNNNFSKPFRRPFVRRRSPVDRDDCYGVRRRVPMTRGFNSYRGRGRYPPRNSGRDFAEDDFDPVGDDNTTTNPSVRYFSRRERSFPPSPGRGGGAHLRRRSRSRSRTRSPKPWHSNRERSFNSRRPNSSSRSPDFRPRARTRPPFSKPNFASSDYGEGYMSPPPSRGRFSPPQRRWGNDRNFGDNGNNPRHRRSPENRVFRRNPRFDGGVGSSGGGRLKSDEYFRPVMRPAKFVFMSEEATPETRECKVETDP